jgi:hypothetical protein
MEIQGEAREINIDGTVELITNAKKVTHTKDEASPSDGRS